MGCEMKDTWTIDGNYSVSYDDGKLTITSLHKRNYGNHLSIWLNQDGYLVTKFGRKSHRIHRIVAERFLGKCPVG